MTENASAKHEARGSELAEIVNCLFIFKCLNHKSVIDNKFNGRRKMAEKASVKRPRMQMRSPRERSDRVALQG